MNKQKNKQREREKEELLAGAATLRLVKVQLQNIRETFLNVKVLAKKLFVN